MIETSGYEYFQKKQTDDTVKDDATPEIPNSFLSKLVETAYKNQFRKKHGYRYDEDIKKFVSYIRMLCGPLAYETIAKNLEGAIPSLPSTNRYIAKTHSNIIEGVVRSHKLLEYLRK